MVERSGVVAHNRLKAWKDVTVNQNQVKEER